MEILTALSIFVIIGGIIFFVNKKRQREEEEEEEQRRITEFRAQLEKVEEALSEKMKAEDHYLNVETRKLVLCEDGIEREYCEMMRGIIEVPCETQVFRGVAAPNNKKVIVRDKFEADPLRIQLNSSLWFDKNGAKLGKVDIILYDERRTLEEKEYFRKYKIDPDKGIRVNLKWSKIENEFTNLREVNGFVFKTTHEGLSLYTGVVGGKKIVQSELVESKSFDSIITIFDTANRLQNEGKHEEAITNYLSIIDRLDEEKDKISGHFIIESNLDNPAIGEEPKLNVTPIDGLFFNLGQSYRACNDFVKAKYAFEKAIEANPKAEAMIFHHLGVTKLQLGDYITSIEDFTKALSQDENFIKAYYMRAVAYANEEGKLHDKDKAKQDVLKYLERYPEDSAANKLMQALDDI